MKHVRIRSAFMAVIMAGGLFATGCKGKNKDTETNINTTTYDTSTAVPAAPVEVSPDAALQNGVRDATKDFPGVSATVTNGEITLSGTIDRSGLQRLMPTLQSLQPKKINNNLTVK